MIRPEDYNYDPGPNSAAWGLMSAASILEARISILNRMASQANDRAARAEEALDSMSRGVVDLMLSSYDVDIHPSDDGRTSIFLSNNRPVVHLPYVDPKQWSQLAQDAIEHGFKQRITEWMMRQILPKAQQVGLATAARDSQPGGS